MITNAQPWDNLKFDLGGVEEVRRKFFGTLYNTYSFFQLYANIDGFNYSDADIKMEDRPEIDRWILSLLNSLIKEVEECYEAYEPTRAGRAIQNFVNENLSNWYVRLCRKRYWGGEYDTDKISAYQTLYKCLETISVLASPIAPFYMDQLFKDLNSVTGRFTEESVHLIDFPKYNEEEIDKALEERMDMAQKISSMSLGLRRKVKIRVRQPLQKIMIPILDESMVPQLEAVKSIVLSEINVKEMEFITDTSGVLVKKIKPNFKALGPKHGKIMKQIAAAIGQMSQEDIVAFEKAGSYAITVNEENIDLTLEDVEIISEDIPGWLVANEGKLTVAMDVNITEELRQEGIAREFINRIQNLRKDSDFDVTDKIKLEIMMHDSINDAVLAHKEYIGSQTLAVSVELVEKLAESEAKAVEIEQGVESFIKIEKVSE
jgi:isoleucyl-tRNA synthetase